MILSNMKTREFPVLDASDNRDIQRLAAGVGEAPARVFIYLSRRESQSKISPTPATAMEIQIGTELSRNACKDALSVLTERGLITKTTVETTTPGRPPNAWMPVDSLSSATTDAYLQHARALLRQADRLTNADEQADRFTNADEPPETTPEEDTSPVIVGLNWNPNALHLPLYAAMEYYSERGLAVESRTFTGSRQVVDAVVSGEVTVGIAGGATLTRARANGVKIVPIAVLFQRPMAVVYTTRSVFGESLTELNQLRGRRVGMPVPSEASTLGQLFLSQANVLDEVEIVDVGGEEEAALNAGRVDAVTGMFADPMRLASGEETVDSLPVAKQYPIYGPALVVTERTLNQRRETLDAFLAATTAGWATAREQPATVANSLLTSGTHPEQVTTVFERAVTEFGMTDAVSRHGWGWHSPETWHRLETALDQSNLLSEYA